MTTAPQLPPDIDPGPLPPGDPFGDHDSADTWWTLWADGLLILLFTWIIFLSVCAGAIVSWAYTAGLLTP